MTSLRFKEMNNMETSTKIMILGVGGAGCNAINTMVNEKIEGVEFLAVNTDYQVLDVLSKRGIPVLHIGDKITEGRGTGNDPKLGEAAAKSNEDEIKERLKGIHMLFITAGEGGGTGTGAAPYIAQCAKELGILTVSIVTYPFKYEGKLKAQIADNGIANLRDKVNSLIVIHNELAKNHFKNCKITDFFAQIDKVLYKAVRGISDIIKYDGYINVDFNDVKRILCNEGSPETIISFLHVENFNNDYDKLVDDLINNKLTDKNNFKAKSILTNIIGPNNFNFEVYSTINEKIVEKIGVDHCFTKSGLVFSESFSENEIYITLVASGLNEEVNQENISLENNSEKDLFININNNSISNEKQNELQNQRNLLNSNNFIENDSRQIIIQKSDNKANFLNKLSIVPPQVRSTIN